MAAIIVGEYDASTFVEGDYATYPQLPPGVEFYQLGMAWTVTVPGDVFGQPAQVGDLLFTMEKPRLWGDFTYGGKLFGTHKGIDWEVDEVRFQVWNGTGEPPDLGPYPNGGCPFTPAHGIGGEWAPGWRIVVDAFYDNTTGRRFGDLTYGAEVFGTSDATATPARWQDITEPSFHIEIGDGMAEGGPRVSVSELVITFLDPIGRWFDMATPQTWRQPQPGTPIRVGLLDPEFHYHPLITGEIERIEDVHDGDGVREVSVRGFGKIMDLVVDLPQVKRPKELASVRFNYLKAAAGWTWDTLPTVFPTEGDAELHADKDPADIVAREQMDTSCMAVGWFMDSTRQGRIRVRPWPIEPTGEELSVVDCYGVEDSLVSHSIVLANDESQLLNYVLTTSIDEANNEEANPAKTVTATNTVSVGRYGKRGRAFGFPMTGLPWFDAAPAQVWADRVAARYAFITRQCESFDIDTQVDHGWLPTLADLDTGRPVRVTRIGLTPLVLTGIVTGWRWRLDPGRWQGTVFVTTTTESL